MEHHNKYLIKQQFLSKVYKVNVSAAICIILIFYTLIVVFGLQNNNIILNVIVKNLCIQF